MVRRNEAELHEAAPKIRGVSNHVHGKTEEFEREEAASIVVHATYFFWYLLYMSMTF